MGRHGRHLQVAQGELPGERAVLLGARRLVGVQYTAHQAARTLSLVRAALKGIVPQASVKPSGRTRRGCG